MAVPAPAHDAEIKQVMGFAKQQNRELKDLYGCLEGYVKQVQEQTGEWEKRLTQVELRSATVGKRESDVRLRKTAASCGKTVWNRRETRVASSENQVKEQEAAQQEQQGRLAERKTGLDGREALLTRVEPVLRDQMETASAAIIAARSELETLLLKAEPSLRTEREGTIVDIQSVLARASTTFDAACQKAQVLGAFDQTLRTREERVNADQNTLQGVAAREQKLRADRRAQDELELEWAKDSGDLDNTRAILARREATIIGRERDLDSEIAATTAEKDQYEAATKEYRFAVNSLETTQQTLNAVLIAVQGHVDGLGKVASRDVELEKGIYRRIGRLEGNVCAVSKTLDGVSTKTDVLASTATISGALEGISIKADVEALGTRVVAGLARDDIVKHAATIFEADVNAPATRLSEVLAGLAQRPSADDCSGDCDVAQLLQRAVDRCRSLKMAPSSKSWLRKLRCRSGRKDLGRGSSRPNIVRRVAGVPALEE
ncbi:hypothetical protein QBC39DRAFT_384870 [Podospora conica]|nr:hypothetical protein QBC39DRAFT_384870 [Schizothecium conicum]